MGKRTKTLIVYYISVIALAICSLTAYHLFNVREQTVAAGDNLQKAAVKTSVQLDNLINSMEYATIDLLSDPEFMPSMATLDYIHRSPQLHDNSAAEVGRKVQTKLYKYSLAKYFFSVNVFTLDGEFFTSRVDRESGQYASKEKADNISWLPEVDALQGKLLILPPHTDQWATNEPNRVFGVARAIPGFILTWDESDKKIVGYIEVQAGYDEFAGIFAPSESGNISVAALINGKELLYSDSGSDPDMAEWLRNRTAYPGLEDAVLPDGTRVLIYTHRSEYTGVDILCIQRRADILHVTNIGVVYIAASLAIALASALYLLVFQRMIAKPIRILKGQMEETELHNLPEHTELDSPNDEIEALNLSYLHLKKRLGQAVSQEIRYRSLQIQANLDSLQSQINPHFMYNILNVLSQQGLESNNEVICDICAKIASMLRYSTSTIERYATIRHEVEHVRNYLTLMKWRYVDNLEFAIDVPEEIMDIAIPKMVLQPIAENSFEHGYERSGGLRRLRIEGEYSQDRWSITLMDDGQGFPPETLRLLAQKFDAIKKSCQANRTPDLEIGGMGLLNTYVRLLLFYHGDFNLDITNLSEGAGTVVCLSAPISQ